MVAAIGIPNHLHQNFFQCDLDLPIVSFYFVPKWGYPLRVGGLFVDVKCDVPLPEP